MAKKTLNPSDALRKKEKQKQAKKNKEKQKQSKVLKVAGQDTKRLEEQISQLENQQDQNAKIKVARLKSKVDRIMEARTTLGISTAKSEKVLITSAKNASSKYDGSYNQTSNLLGPQGKSGISSGSSDLSSDSDSSDSDTNSSEDDTIKTRVSKLTTESKQDLSFIPLPSGNEPSNEAELYYTLDLPEIVHEVITGHSNIPTVNAPFYPPKNGNANMPPLGARPPYLPPMPNYGMPFRPPMPNYAIPFRPPMPNHPNHALHLVGQFPPPFPPPPNGFQQFRPPNIPPPPPRSVQPASQSDGNLPVVHHPPSSLLPKNIPPPPFVPPAGLIPPPFAIQHQQTQAQKIEPTSQAVISAEPVLRDLKKELTQLVPAAVRKKRKAEFIGPAQPVKKVNQKQAEETKAKDSVDEEYQKFMNEMKEFL